MSLTNMVLNWWKRLGGKYPETISWSPVSGQGSQGQTVAMWQTVIGVVPDGSFGPETDRLTREWQQAHGIDPDGVVGPLTWSEAMKGVGSSATPRAGGAPPGTRPLPQSIANQAAITAFAIETLNNRTIQMGDMSRRQINGVDVLARIEPHRWTHRNGKLVTNLDPPIRGVTLYQVIDPSQFGSDPVVWRVSEHGCDMGGEYRTETNQGGHMAEIGSQGERGCPSDIRGNPDKYRLKR
jgi:hypothetical protein